jgi:hypothetical protein
MTKGNEGGMELGLLRRMLIKPYKMLTFASFGADVMEGRLVCNRFLGHPKHIYREANKIQSP